MFPNLFYLVHDGNFLQEAKFCLKAVFRGESQINVEDARKQEL